MTSIQYEIFKYNTAIYQQLHECILASSCDSIIAEVILELIVAVGHDNRVRVELCVHVWAIVHEGRVDVDCLAIDGRKAPLSLPSAWPGRKTVAVAAPAHVAATYLSPQYSSLSTKRYTCAEAREHDEIIFDCGGEFISKAGFSRQHPTNK